MPEQVFKALLEALDNYQGKNQDIAVAKAWVMAHAEVQNFSTTEIAPDVTDQNTPKDAWEVLEKLIGSYDGPEDWSLEHDHYLYGTPKRHNKPKIS